MTKGLRFCIGIVMELICAPKPLDLPHGRQGF